MAAIAIAQRDVDLMLRIRSGDETGFALLLKEYRTPVTRFLYRMVLNQAVAEELAQEVFFRVYRARASYQPTARFSTWLFCIATRLALNWRRDARREAGQESLDEASADRPVRQIADRRPTVEQALVHRSSVEEIRQAIHALPAKQRAAILMHKYHDMDYSQIGRALNCSESAVKSLVFRAYGNLRKSLAHAVAV
ncbi:MAG: RNA polymerase sigma factor [Acidobacteria bacterium]|nr:RNA polymerase sigma factor [Acidobacteriota bacterium]